MTTTTTETDDTRLGRLEGQVSLLVQGVSELRQEFREELRAVNAHIDRLYLALIGIGAAQIGLLITLVVK